MRLKVLAMMGAALFNASAAGANDGGQTPVQQQQASASDAAPDPAAAAKVAAVQRHVDAYRSGSLDRFVATFTPDAEVYANGLVAIGHAQIRALYAANFAPGAPSIRIDGSGMNGDRVYLSAGYVFDNGQEMCCSYSEYEVSGGKISYLESSG